MTKMTDEHFLVAARYAAKAQEKGLSVNGWCACMGPLPECECQKRARLLSEFINHFDQPQESEQ